MERDTMFHAHLHFTGNCSSRTGGAKDSLAFVVDRGCGTQGTVVPHLEVRPTLGGVQAHLQVWNRTKLSGWSGVRNLRA